MKRNSKLMDNDIPLRSQIRTLRVLLLGTIIIFTLYAIRFQNMYSEIWVNYQSSVELNRQILDVVRETRKIAQQISEHCQEVIHLNQEVSGLVQWILELLEFVR